MKRIILLLFCSGWIFVSVEAQNLDSLSVYPNPFANSANIYLSFPSSDTVSLKIMNATGFVVKTIFNHFYMAGGAYTLVVDTDSLPDGKYFLICNVGNHPNIVKVAIKKSTTMGIAQNPSFSSVNLYPNPTSGFLNIPINGQKTITIFDREGKQVFQSVVEQNSIDVQGLKKGSYFVDVHSDKQDIVQKIDFE